MINVGFPPVAARTARVLILGSLPGVESLKQRRYYAHKHNAFWKIMGALTGADPALPYGQRLSLLKKHAIALWDVCHSAKRVGSLDSSIEQASVAANDFPAFFKTHRHIRLICFNGQPAARLFHRLVTPRLTVTIPHIILPSTSPAHASMNFEEKLLRWRQALTTS